MGGLGVCYMEIYEGRAFSQRVGSEEGFRMIIGGWVTFNVKSLKIALIDTKTSIFVAVYVVFIPPGPHTYALACGKTSKHELSVSQKVVSSTKVSGNNNV